MTDIWKTCFTCLTCVVFPKFKILRQVTHLAGLLCLDFIVIPLKVKIKKNQQPFNRLSPESWKWKRMQLVSKQLLQDSGMCDVSYVRYSEKCLMKIYGVFMEKKCWCPSLGQQHGGWKPTDKHSRQTFKHTLSQK